MITKLLQFIIDMLHDCKYLDKTIHPKSLHHRIEQAIREEIAIVPYNPEWRTWFANEAEFLYRVLPELIFPRICRHEEKAIILTSGGAYNVRTEKPIRSYGTGYI